MWKATVRGLAMAVALTCCAVPTTVAAPWQATPRVLYQASWSHGIHGWAHGGGSWTVLGGMLSYSGADVSMLLAPYTPNRGSYALEAAIRLVAWKTSGYSESQGFGLLI